MNGASSEERDRIRPGHVIRPSSTSFPVGEYLALVVSGQKPGPLAPLALHGLIPRLADLAVATIRAQRFMVQRFRAVQ